MRALLNWFKPWECEAYDGAIGFAQHRTWTRAGAVAWAAMYPAWADVVVWRAASFGRLPKVDSERRTRA